MITLNSSFRIPQRVLFAVALVASFTATAADVAPPSAATEAANRGAPRGFYSQTVSPAASPEAEAERNKSGKIDPNPVATTDAKIPNNPPSNSTSAPTVGIGPGSVTFRGSHGIGPQLVQSVPCPRTNVNFGRAAINNSPFMAHVQNFADTQCANRGAPRGFNYVRIQSCNPNGNGGYSAPIEVTCLR